MIHRLSTRWNDEIRRHGFASAVWTIFRLSEQIFRSTFVVTAATVRSSRTTVQAAEYRLAKVAKTRLDASTMVWRGSEHVGVSDRELTIADDALTAPAWLGGVRHLADVLRSYREGDEWNQSALLRRMAQVNRGVAYKRLGLLTETHALDAPDLVRACLEQRSTGIVAVDASVRRKGHISKRLGLRVNVDLGDGRRSRSRTSSTALASGRGPSSIDSAGPASSEVA
ncbi:MAG: hypothetical protein HYY06_23665 [Deltaproteobacteria bacterium]|nr:hypothetical protein [Deltaproteobacteria bacterium]